MSKKDKFPGFEKLMIRDITNQEDCVTTDNVTEFPLKDSGNYISEDKLLIIKPLETDNSLWRLIPTNNESMQVFLSLFTQVKGDVRHINNSVKEFYKKKVY